MEDWQIDFEWLRVRHFIKDSMGTDKLPDLQSILFLIGVQELGRWDNGKFTKEEKQDLIHIAVCTLLEGTYYEFEGRDQDGWPHFKSLKPFNIKGISEQEVYLKKCIIEYFQLKEEPARNN
ncbi:MAG TPA: hypothetical protein PKD85_03690 [Saprospiraceae bacterium]|nr:hypothetical protein [Saprospiraceae bacterium]